MSRSPLPEDPASPPLRYLQHSADMLDHLPPSGRAEKFPEEASFRIAISSA